MLQLTEAVRKVYRLIYHTLSHPGFSPERRILEGQKLARENPHYANVITEAYLDSVLDYLPSEADLYLAELNMEQLLSTMQKMKSRRI